MSEAQAQAQAQAQGLVQQMQALEAYFSELTQKERRLLNILQETSETIKSLKSISEKPESDALLPIGMGVYVPAKVSSDVKVIVSVGAGVAMGKDIDSAVNYLESRIKEMEVALQDTNNAKQNVAMQLEQYNAQLNQFMQPSKPVSG